MNAALSACNVRQQLHLLPNCGTFLSNIVECHMLLQVSCAAVQMYIQSYHACRYFDLVVDYQLCNIDLVEMLLSSEYGGDAASRSVWRQG